MDSTATRLEIRRLTVALVRSSLSQHGVNWDDQSVDRPWNPEQATLESVYWAETTVHVPLSLLCFYLYATRNRNRYLVEAFVGGAQLVGSYGYYGPEVRSSEEGSDELRSYVYGISTPSVYTYMRKVAAANPTTVSNVMNPPSFATRFARRSSSPTSTASPQRGLTTW